jgi:XTP/dITP diphosphohydrolase
MNKKKIVFATNNQHKIKEIHQAISDEFTILNLKEIGFYEDIEEPFDTLEENAQAKTSTIYNRMGYNCFADDTGLEIDALQGKPGVFSARYAGPEGNPENNIKKCLKKWKASPIAAQDSGPLFRLSLKAKNTFSRGRWKEKSSPASTAPEVLGMIPSLSLKATASRLPKCRWS